MIKNPIQPDISSLSTDGSQGDLYENAETRPGTTEIHPIAITSRLPGVIHLGEIGQDKETVDLNSSSF